MLWTGSAYREFSVWLVHYPGGLTETEEAFAEAMTRHDERRSRRRRLAATAAFAVLLAVLAIVGGLWRRSVTEARRAEATKLLALGRLELDDGPTTALAYATASLELLDGPETRRFALEALWRGPTAFRLSVAESHGACTPSFSPDGRWLAQDHEPGRLWFYPRDGSAPTALETVFDSARQLIHFEFGHDSNLLVCSYWVLDEDRFDHRIGFWSVPDGREIRTLELEGPTEATLAGDRLVTATKMGDGKRWLRSWPLGGGEPSMLGHIDSPWWDVDPALTWLGWAKDRDVLLHSLGTSVTTSRPIVAHHPEPPRHVGLDPDGHRFATAGESGLVWLWSLADGEAKLLRTFEESEAVSELVFHPAGSKLAWGEVGTIKLWDIEGPPEADPLELRTTAVDLLAFHPDGRWLYSSDPLEEATLWNLGRRYPHILRGHKDWVQGLQKSRRIFSIDEVGAELRVGSEGNTLVTTSGEGMILLPVDGKPPTTLGGLPSGSIALSLALGPRDRLVAAGTQRVRGRGEIWVWDLHTGEARKLDPGWVVSETPLADDVSDDTVSALVFTPDGRLISAGGGGIISWDLEDGSGKVLLEQTGEFPTFALSAGGRHLVVTDGDYADPALTRSKLTRVDLEDGTTQPVTSHGTRVQARALAFDPTGRILVTGDLDGVVRVGPVTGAEPHLFLGHKGSVDSVAVSPGGQWIASGGEDGTIRLWPMPDLSEPPLHTWPRDELIAKLKTLTNLRVVHDEESSTGWKIDIGPFPGWATVPSW
jgi:WD40 repeat protein